MSETVEAAETTILVADDDEDIRALIAEQLARERYAVRAAGSIAEIRRHLAAEPIDLLVLDLNLPDGDGLALCRELRAEGHVGAIIMVTARGGAIDRVLGLELGADDYLTKPFEPRELLARIRNLLRRQRAEPSGRPRGARFARFADWRLDLLQRRLVAPDGRLVILSSGEFRLLDRFVDAPNRVLTRETLSPERRATVAFDRTIDLQISRLRQKLSDAGGPGELILTVRNEGYVFAADVGFE
ncbi:response regulator transcription factor [Sphingomonas nostoxanthinifaciens]|uniref:response regulator transcription factor n=1 Tax=Sphingomonas nostoxanthinifaciens TaxID=2872652 RepID=UPI001CC1D30E|nr:response regulator transcription factor [Sphingomonas nostoxanthinifaciens]UAK25067.1 response regulator transcription factor [Sphingomonas nostoxanthinifaciens]